jgi:hypothetical protein
LATADENPTKGESDLYMRCSLVVGLLDHKPEWRSSATILMVDSVPALAAIRLYLYCSKRSGDPTITLWSTFVVTQLQIFAAHACTFGFVITKRMNGMVSHFGLANQALSSGPTETYRSQRTESSKKPVRGDGESQEGIIMKTLEYEVTLDDEAESRENESGHWL